MNWINGWKTIAIKQWDKGDLVVRISKLTIFELKIDLSRGFRLMIFNYGIEKWK